MNDEQKAAFLMLIEKCQLGALTHDEDIGIIIRDKTVPLNEAVRTILPGVNITEAKRTYKDFQNMITNSGKKNE